MLEIPLITWLKKYIAFVNRKPYKRKLSFHVEMARIAMATQEENESSMHIHFPGTSCAPVIHIYVSFCAPVLQVGINNDLEDLKMAYSMEKENLFCILTLWSCHYFHSACPIILNKALFWNLQYMGQETVQNILLIHSFIQPFIQGFTKQSLLCFMKHI